MKKILLGLVAALFATQAWAVQDTVLTFKGDKYTNEEEVNLNFDLNQVFMIGVGKDGKVYLGQDGQTLQATGIVVDKSYNKGFNSGKFWNGYSKGLKDIIDGCNVLGATNSAETAIEWIKEQGCN